MNKIIKNLTWASVLLLTMACTKTPVNDKEVTKKAETTDNKTICGTMEVLAVKIQEDPGLADRMNAIELQTSDYVNKAILNKKKGNSVLNDGPIEIPVVVHVIWHHNTENISDAQIASQIVALNEDYSATNPDLNLTPAIFKNVASDFEVHFTLQSIDRTYSSKEYWTKNDDCKRPNKGGVAVDSPLNTLNIWVCPLFVNSPGGGTLLGYAQFPGGDPATDGVVISPVYFGTVGSLADKVNYGKGRTATHEIGHWMNLRHIWGDQPCGTDYVNDTPVHADANFGCPAYPKTNNCNGNIEMTMNYMDYTNETCKYMFTEGQKMRTRAVFTVNGARSGFVQTRIFIPKLPTIPHLPILIH
jgi:Pregnancy-associated plasma protein-A